MQVDTMSGRHRERLAPLYPANFNGYLYFGFANFAALVGIVAAGLQLRSPSALEWLTVPLAFLFANFAEWLAHKGPMHHKRDLMEILFERHTMVHHLYFPKDDMAAPNHHHWGYVLFPWWAIFLVYVATAPFALATGYLISANCGWMFMGTGVGYYLIYEWLHLMHHLPDDHPVSRLPVVRWLRQHHLHHHDFKLMAHKNFNVSFPIADYVLGTAHRPTAVGGVEKVSDEAGTHAQHE